MHIINLSLRTKHVYQSFFHLFCFVHLLRCCMNIIGTIILEIQTIQIISLSCIAVRLSGVLDVIKNITRMIWRIVMLSSEKPKTMSVTLRSNHVLSAFQEHFYYFAFVVLVKKTRSTSHFCSSCRKIVWNKNKSFFLFTN